MLYKTMTGKILVDSLTPLDKLPITLFGGSFNPIHNGHIMMIKEILSADLTHKILISCAYQNPFKRLTKANGEKDKNAKHRLQMVKCATAKLSRVEVYDTEILTKKISYTINTVKDIYNNILSKKEQKRKIGLIIGSDLLKDIWRWKDVQELSTLVKLIVYPRPQYDLVLHRGNKKQSMISTFLSNDEYQFEYIILSGFRMYDISSERLRIMQNSKELIDYVPKEVYNYIHTHKVYG